MYKEIKLLARIILSVNNNEVQPSTFKSQLFAPLLFWLLLWWVAGGRGGLGERLSMQIFIVLGLTELHQLPDYAEGLEKLSHFELFSALLFSLPYSISFPFWSVFFFFLRCCTEKKISGVMKLELRRDRIRESVHTQIILFSAGLATSQLSLIRVRAVGKDGLGAV